MATVNAFHVGRRPDFEHECRDNQEFLQPAADSERSTGTFRAFRGRETVKLLPSGPG